MLHLKTNFIKMLRLKLKYMVKTPFLLADLKKKQRTKWIQV